MKNQNEVSRFTNINDTSLCVVWRVIQGVK
jgi:hypothetical protein